MIDEKRLAEIFREEFKEIFAREDWGDTWMVGHSLGRMADKLDPPPKTSIEEDVAESVEIAKRAGGVGCA